MTAILEPGARRSTSPSVFAETHVDDCNLAIWQREPIEGMDALIVEDAGDVRFTAPLMGLDARLVSELNAAGFPDLPVREALIADIVALAERFCPMLDVDHVELRLEIVTTDSCRKFHADYVRSRLITTYVGEGTQWIDTEDATRVSAGIEPRHIQTLQAGDVGVFKGKLSTEHPAIHRSPPIGDTGAARLLLVLNPPSKS